MARKEARCPDCQSYCKQHPTDPDRFYCPRDGWFTEAEATHTVTA